MIWGLRDFSIVRLNVQTGAETIIKNFSQDSMIGPIITAEPDLYHITMKQEGESSYDKWYWAFLLQGSLDDYRARYLFTWDRQEDKVLGLYTIPNGESNIDWVGMSPLGNWVLIGGDWDNGGNLAGLTMANKELTQFHRLDYTTAHSDIGLDVEGKEVIVMQNPQTDYIDLIPIDLNTQPILEPGGSYNNTNRIPLIRLFYDAQSSIGLNSGVHISCNVSGYCLVSTNTEPGLPEQNWFDRTITLVRLDRTHAQVFYLAKVYNTTGAYWEETQATITNDGSRVLWASNWGQNVGEERVFLIQLDMPGDWITPGTTTTVLPATTTAESSTTITSGSTTTTATVCPAGELYGEHSEEAELLRHVRDEVLSQTPEGQEIIRLYYVWSPAIVKVMEKDDEFVKQLKELIDGILPMIR